MITLPLGTAFNSKAYISKIHDSGIQLQPSAVKSSFTRQNETYGNAGSIGRNETGGGRDPSAASQVLVDENG